MGNDAPRGVSATAVGVALIRERESRRPDSLYADPLASVFVEEARAAYPADEWRRIEGLVEPFYEGRTVGVRVVDDRVQEWVSAGCRQLVILGAGLDTRAFRLPVPRTLHVFEVDLPELFAFKEPVLARAGARPRCPRSVVPADLRGDWVGALQAAGFDASVPSAWLDEGVLGYLTQSDARAVATSIGELSAPGSRFSAPRMTVDERRPHYRELKRLAFGADGEQRDLRGLGPDVDEWLQDHGWRTEFRRWKDLVAPLGRSVQLGGPDDGIVQAVRGSEPISAPGGYGT